MIEWHEWNRYWHRRMPILEWLPRYRVQHDLKFDLIAGFTVAVMLVPQEMSFAALMGVPAQYGLYTAATAPLLYPLFGSSRALSVANAAEGSLLVGVMLRSAEIQSVEERVATGILLTFFAGVVMICCGFLHQGGIVSFFSRTSMNGYITATAFLIITSQLPGWLGISLHKKTPLTIFTMVEVLSEVPNTNVYSFGLGVFSLVFLSITKQLKAVLAKVKSTKEEVGLAVAKGIEEGEDSDQDGDEVVEIQSLKSNENSPAVVVPLLSLPPAVSLGSKSSSSVPAALTPRNAQGLGGFLAAQPRLAFILSLICDGNALIVCVIGMVLGRVLGDDGIKLTGAVPNGLPVPVFPPNALGSVLPWERLQNIVTNAATIAVIFFMSSVATGSRLANQAGYEISPNQELLGLGFANLGSSFFQGMPSSAGLSRSAVNSQTARTPLASMVTAVLVVLTLVFLTGPLYYLPQAPLAAIILLSARSLIDFAEPKWLKRVNHHDFCVWVAAFIGTLTRGLLQGLLISVAASLIAIMAKSKKPHVATLGQMPDGSFVDIESASSGSIDLRPTELHDVVVVRMAHALYFGNASHFIHGIERKLDIAKARGRVVGVVVDGSRMNSIDASAIHALKEYSQKLCAREQHLTFANLTQETAASLLVSGLWKEDEVQQPLTEQLTGDVIAAVTLLRGWHCP